MCEYMLVAVSTFKAVSTVDCKISPLPLPLNEKKKKKKDSFLSRKCDLFGKNWSYCQK